MVQSPIPQPPATGEAPPPDQPLRVAIVAESFLPQLNGVTTTVCRIVEHLTARGHVVLVLAPGAGPVSYAGAPVLRLPGAPLPGYRSFSLGLPVRRQLTAALRAFQPDVVHLASPALLGLAAVDVARRWALPTVAAFQTDLAGFASHYGVRAATPIWSLLRRIHTAVDRTLVPSSATLQQLTEQGFPRLRLWPRGVDAERFHPGHRDPELHRELSPDGRPVIGYVGRLAAEKRVHWLAHVARLQAGRIVVVGDGPQRGRLRRALPDAVFTGARSGEELSRLYATFDLFVHTGADETFGQTVQEAMASGVPVVAPASGGPVDLVLPEGNGLLYAPDSVREFRLAVGRLLHNAPLRASMARGARTSVEGRTWEVINDRLVDHYRAVAGRPSSAPAAARA